MSDFRKSCESALLHLYTAILQQDADGHVGDAVILIERALGERGRDARLQLPEGERARVDAMLALAEWDDEEIDAEVKACQALSCAPDHAHRLSLLLDNSLGCLYQAKRLSLPEAEDTAVQANFEIGLEALEEALGLLLRQEETSW